MQLNQKAESRMAERKPILDRASGRLISAGPEEVDATQPLLDILIDECGWDRNQIVSRPQWRVPGSPSDKRRWPVDVAIFDSPAHCRKEEHVQILCECKRPDEKSGMQQLKMYLDREPHARMGIWFNGIDYAIVYKTKEGYEQAPAGTRIPGPTDPLEPDGTPATMTYARLSKAPSLVPVVRRIRDRLAAQDTNVNRDEEILPDLSSLLLLKILDEQAHRLQPGEALEFQRQEGKREDTAKHVKAMLQREAKKHAGIFGHSGVHLAIDDESIGYAVEQLQSYRMLGNDANAISTAFQVLRGRAYKGEEGQYFTPPSVVKIAVAAIAPKHGDRVIDPACGSGSFLAEALNAVSERLESIAGEGSTEHTVGMRDWSTQKLYAIDKDTVSVRLSKAYLSLLGDGSAHVFKADALRKSHWSRHLTETMQDGSFSVVLTNPPFGTRLQLDANDGRAEGYQVCRQWVRDTSTGSYGSEEDRWVNREVGVVFLERCYNLLEPDGRLAIVLPDTYLFSPSYRWLVEWICTKFTVTHSINVPIEAFEPYCRAKTSILVLKKAKPGTGHRIIGMLTESYGQDKKGNPLFRLDVEGNRTAVLEDEMAEAAALLRSRSRHKSKLRFTFEQQRACKAGVLTASYYWREPYLKALDVFSQENKCTLVSIGELIENGELTYTMGHGSPHGQFKGKGDVPYVKVSDIKNWRINENPKYFIPEETAERLRRDRGLEAFDIVIPTRASKNIGLGAVVMPWQTQVVLTKEIAVLRCTSEGRVSPWLLLVMLSLRVVNDQFRFLVQMQTNREDLGRRLFELKIPVPEDTTVRERWEQPAEDYFRAQVGARESYRTLIDNLGASHFVDRP